MAYPISTERRFPVKSLEEKLTEDRVFEIKTSDYVLIGVEKMSNKFWIRDTYQNLETANKVASSLNKQAKDYGCDNSIHTVFLVYNSSGNYISGLD